MQKLNWMGLLCVALLVTSCIKSEALNEEADIVKAMVSQDILKREPIVGNDKVTFLIKANTDLAHQAPTFELTEGATIEPESGTVRDFTEAQKYTVTSQNGRWKKVYTVEYVANELQTNYHFEDQKFFVYEDRDRFPIFIELDESGKEVMEWGSGNQGFYITASEAPASDYPTYQDASGMKGKCAKLVTRSTGEMGAMMNMPLAAGNLFIGKFSINIFNPLKSTKFGYPFNHEPYYLTGFYKYKAGEMYQEKGVDVPGKKDDFDIYAIFYEVDKNTPTLDGSNSLTHPNLVSVARLENRKETDTWTFFAIPFVLKEGKTIDAEKLKNGQYNISLIFSSSIDGAKFNGAVGSTLCVDEVNIFSKPEE